MGLCGFRACSNSTQSSYFPNWRVPRLLHFYKPDWYSRYKCIRPSNEVTMTSACIATLLQTPCMTSCWSRLLHGYRVCRRKSRLRMRANRVGAPDMRCTPLHCCLSPLPPHSSGSIWHSHFCYTSCTDHTGPTEASDQQQHLFAHKIRSGNRIFHIDGAANDSVGWSKHDVHLVNVLLAVFLRLSQPSVHGRQYKHKLLAVIADTK